MRLRLLIALLGFGLTACTGNRSARKAHKPGPKQTFVSEGGNFSLRPPAEMRRLGSDSVPWAATIPTSNENGVVVYFFAEKTSVALASPHIRVEYLSRSIRGAETSEQLFTWLKGLFLNEDQKGKLLSEGKTITTADGQEVPYLEIAIPQSFAPDDPTVLRSAKHMIWAYVPAKDGHFIGFNATTVDPATYPDLKKDFLVTVASFQQR